MRLLTSFLLETHVKVEFAKIMIEFKVLTPINLEKDYFLIVSSLELNGALLLLDTDVALLKFSRVSWV